MKMVMMTVEVVEVVIMIIANILGTFIKCQTEF